MCLRLCCLLSLFCPVLVLVSTELVLCPVVSLNTTLINGTTSKTSRQNESQFRYLILVVTDSAQWSFLLIPSVVPTSTEKQAPLVGPVVCMSLFRSLSLFLPLSKCLFVSDKAALLLPNQTARTRAFKFKAADQQLHYFDSDNWPSSTHWRIYNARAIFLSLSFFIPFPDASLKIFSTDWQQQVPAQQYYTAVH